MRYVLALMLLLLASPALAATITGTAYTHELQVARYSVLQIDTVPPQRIILDDGTYLINVPQGTYTMSVSSTINGKMYDDKLTVNISDEGTYNYDFILFPAEMNGTQPLPSVEDITIPETPQAKDIGWIPALVLLLLLVLLVLFLARRKWWSHDEQKAPESAGATEKTAAVESAPVLPADLEGVIAAIKQEGGRTTQKELRKHIPCSEAKMSMMLTELEHKGRIERIKKGRGNLIILK